jgi:stage V sporulation protein AE
MKYVYVFIVGGLLCAIAQLLIDKTNFSPARIMVSYVISGVVLTAIGLYEPIVEFANAGATVPIIGFGYTLAKGAKKAVEADGWLGVLGGGVKGASAGIAAAIVFGMIFSVISKPKAK